MYAGLFLFLFIAVPLAEIAILIKLGGVIGLVPTIALVIMTAVVGTFLLRRQGLAVLMRAQDTMREGQMPLDPVIDGICLLIAGAFLLTPGLITDLAGFLLLVPPLRRSLARWAFSYAMRHANIDIHVGQMRTGGRTSGGQARGAARNQHTGSRRPGSRDGSPTVIDGEFEPIDSGTGSDVADSSSRTDRSSPWNKNS